MLCKRLALRHNYQLKYLYGQRYCYVHRFGGNRTGPDREHWWSGFYGNAGGSRISALQNGLLSIEWAYVGVSFIAFGGSVGYQPIVSKW